jgi:hypothetical protein
VLFLRPVMHKFFYIIAAVVLVLEVYIYQAIRTLTDNTWIRIGYWVVSLAVYGVFVYELTHIQRSDRDPI